MDPGSPGFFIISRQGVKIDILQCISVSNNSRDFCEDQEESRLADCRKYALWLSLYVCVITRLSVCKRQLQGRPAHLPQNMMKPGNLTLQRTSAMPR